MPSKYLRKGPNKLKKCSERRTNSCSDETDGCCGIIACDYCLEWETYDGIERGIANFPEGGTAWTGTVANAEFVAYWERNDYSVCEFVVYFDGQEVYRKSCEEGQSCRDSSDETTAMLGYESGTLRWTKYEPRPLPTVEDPETGCRTHFCGDCHCSCRVLCVVITEPDGITIHRGEVPDISYSDCEAPEWSGTVGPHAITLTLDRDQETGGCIIGGSVSGQAADWLLVSGCQDLSAAFTLADYTTVDVTCKECECVEEDVRLCCGGRALVDSLQLTMVYPGTSSTVECGDTVLTLSYVGGEVWEGSTTAVAEVPDGGGEACVPFTVFFRFYCDPGGPVYQLLWRIVYLGVETPDAPELPPDADGKRWCGLIKQSEDCECPYLGVWGENNTCGLGFLWNGFFTFLVEELPESCT